MRYLFLLSGDCAELGKEEILSLFPAERCSLFCRIVDIELKGNQNSILKTSERLAYTKSIYRLLFECNSWDLIKQMQGYDWGSIYKKDFSIRICRAQNGDRQAKNLKSEAYSEKQLAAFVWKSIKNPRVNLEDANTQITLFFLKNKVYCCVLLKKLDNYFQSRRPHLRPAPSPTSLHPKLARAMVNLTGAKKGDTMVDPFCGSGGILLEAGLMGIKSEGYDINGKMVWKSIVNLRHYGIKNCKLKVKDFFEINGTYGYIATDLPYGLNACIMENVRITKSNKSKIKPFVNDFYLKIVKKLEEVVSKRAVVIFPHYANYKKLIERSRLKIKREFSIYVHSNLTRKIVVLECRNR